MCSNSKRTRRSGTSTASNSWYGTHRSVGFPDRSRHSKNHDPGAKFSKKLMPVPRYCTGTGSTRLKISDSCLRQSDTLNSDTTVILKHN